MPEHVGIIVDGNGRWASQKGLSRSEGHKMGAKNMKSLAKYIINKGVKYLSLYIFSTENFKRDKNEVNYLMKLFINYFENEFNELDKENIKIVFSGSKLNLAPKVIKAMDSVTLKTKNNTKGTINFCLNYGSHNEIIEAVKKISSDVSTNKINIDELDENIFNSYLYQNLPNLDLLIRTGKELRLSNFMLWQASYAELYFTDVLFPDFDSKCFDEAVCEYSNRNRRFGGIDYEKPNY